MGLELDGIKEVGTVQQSVSSQPQKIAVKVYTIPITRDMQLADGSGTAKVIVQQITITAEQLNKELEANRARIALIQKDVDDLQLKLDAIKTLEGKN